MPNKYRNIPTIVDGIKFPSKAEARRWVELCLLEKAGEIRKLERQPPFPYHDDDGKVAFTYFGDFAYFEGKQGNRIVEDVKGKATTIYKLKKRLVEQRYRIKIREIRYNDGWRNPVDK